MNKLSRRLLYPLSTLTIGLHFNKTHMDCKSYPFDNKLIPLEMRYKNNLNQDTNKVKNPVLHLIGVATQKQKLYNFLPVEVADVGVHASRPLIDQLLAHMERKNYDLVDIIYGYMTQCNRNSMSITLKFNKTLSRKQVMEIFNATLNSINANQQDGNNIDDNNSMQQKKELLTMYLLKEISRLIGPEGVNIRDELIFMWVPREVTSNDANTQSYMDIVVSKHTISGVNRIVLSSNVKNPSVTPLHEMPVDLQVLQMFLKQSQPIMLNNCKNPIPSKTQTHLDVTDDASMQYALYANGLSEIICKELKNINFDA